MDAKIKAVAVKAYEQVYGCEDEGISGKLEEFIELFAKRLLEEICK